VRGQPPQPFAIGHPFELAVADSGIASPTRITVGDVRRHWTEAPSRYEMLFDQIAMIVEEARRAMALGEPAALGPLMDANHDVLAELGVSCEKLDRLAAAARNAGAGGAKLSGGGRGGNLIALVTHETAGAVVTALRQTGAANVIVTRVDDGLA
jgi:mevalonate kinase